MSNNLKYTRVCRFRGVAFELAAVEIESRILDEVSPFVSHSALNLVQ